MVTQTITLSMIPGGVTPRIYASQNDHGLRVFVFNLVDENGGYAIPSGTTALLNVLKPDRTVVSETCTWSGSTVTADCTEQMTAVAGNVHCEVRLVAANGDAVGSANFILGVESNPLASGVVSESDFDSISDMVDRAVAAASIPPTYVTDWLDENITQETGYVIDKSLTIENAAADAKAAGDLIRAAFVVGEASGSIASFTDGADNVPLKDLVVNVSPVQDLHGQAHPYPPGGGKNKLYNVLTTRTVGGVTITVKDDGSMVLSGTSTSVSVVYLTSEYTLGAGSYVLTTGLTSSSGADLRMYIGSSVPVIATTSIAFTISEDTTYTNVGLRIPNGTTFNNVTIYPMIYASSETDTSWSPYTNICPISGWTEANVTRTGKNLIGGYTFAAIIASKIQGSSIDTINKTVYYAAARANNVVLFDKFKPNTQYTVFWKTSVSGQASNLCFKYTDGTEKTFNESVIVSATGKSIALLSGRWMTGTTNLLYDEFGIIEGVQTADDFEQYTSDVYNITFGSAGTVYGGTLDVTSGMLTVTYKDVDLGTLNWSYRASGTAVAPYFYTAYTGIASPGNPATRPLDALCNKYAIVPRSESTFVSPSLCGDGSLTAITQIQVKDDRFTDAAAFKTAASGTILVYKLAQPLSVQLSATTINSLLGNNNIFADTGSVASCEYRADTKLYIEKLTTPDNDMVADANITSGSYFMVNNSLYLATANIANGGAITPGTNCTLTNLAAALNAINS